MRMRLNHIGFVVRDISESAELFRVLGLREVTKPETDPLQKVVACFMATERDNDAHIELIEPSKDHSPVSNFLKKRGGGLHHICFEVDDLEKTFHDLKRNGFKIVVPPEDCEGYDRSFNRQGQRVSKVAFFFLSDKFLIELLEKG
jgi:methylmalonyl-CoA/ethylmalonyl-CoA epimerase